MSTSKIALLLGSTRQGRQGDKVAHWAKSVLDGLSVPAEVIDLRDWPLPFFDSAVSPAYAGGVYSDPLTAKWSEKIKSFSSLIIITPEYNHGYPAVLKNALDHLYSEWNGKLVSFVGYSASPLAASRAVEQLRQVVIELQMIPVRPAVYIPTVQNFIKDSELTLDQSYTDQLIRVVAAIEPSSTLPSTGR